MRYVPTVCICSEILDPFNSPIDLFSVLKTSWARTSRLCSMKKERDEESLVTALYHGMSNK